MSTTLKTSFDTSNHESATRDEWMAGNLSYHLKSRPKWNRGVKCCVISDGTNNVEYMEMVK